MVSVGEQTTKESAEPSPKSDSDSNRGGRVLPIRRSSTFLCAANPVITTTQASMAVRGRMRRGSAFAVVALACVLVVAFAPNPHVAIAEETTTTTAPSTSSGEERFEFQAEVSRLLDIIINSLYTNRDIFLRELISNASDALDKIRLLSLTRSEVLATGKDLEVRVSVDKEANALLIRDSGVGMTREDLVNNLGTIAKSGTSSFLDAMASGSDSTTDSLIGQFGVGFYAAFLAADTVQVVSKHNDDPKQYVWESAADGKFRVFEDTPGADGGNPDLGRGTLIKLFLKPEAAEYLDTRVLGNLVTRYSEFISYPIFLEEEETREVEEDAAEEDEVDLAGLDLEDDDDLDDAAGEDGDDEGGEEAKKPAKVKRTVVERVWRLKNDAKAIWLKSPGEVQREDYYGFFRAIARDLFYGKPKDPLTYTHFKAEGDVEFRSILYVPKTVPADIDRDFLSNFSRVKMYVRRVFISDTFDDLLPKWLSWVVGVVDSDTLPLNVSRESLQQHASLKTIKKKLIRKVLDMIKRFAEKGVERTDEEREALDAKKAAMKDDEVAAFEKEQQAEIARGYAGFYKSFGRFLKMGIIEDQTNRIRLCKLIRFKTSHPDFSSASDDNYTSFTDYVDRMPEGQKKIYYLIGSSFDEVAGSSFAEKLVSKGYEVIYFYEAVDEYFMQHITEFEDVKTQNAAREDLALEETKDEKKRQKQLRTHYRPMTKWWKGLLPSDVDTVRMSNRLTSSPCVVLSSKYGYTANMEKVARAQAIGDPDKHMAFAGSKVLELNPLHPSIKRLHALFEAEDPKAATLATVMYETSLIESGYAPKDVRSFAGGVFGVLNQLMEVDPSAEVVDDIEVAEEPEPEPEPEVEGAAGLSMDDLGMSMADLDLADLDLGDEFEDVVKEEL